MRDRVRIGSGAWQHTVIGCCRRLSVAFSAPQKAVFFPFFFSHFVPFRSGYCFRGRVSLQSLRCRYDAFYYILNCRFVELQAWRGGVIISVCRLLQISVCRCSRVFFFAKFAKFVNFLKNFSRKCGTDMSVSVVGSTLFCEAP